MPRTTAGCRSVPRHRARACTAPREHPRRPLHAPRWCPAPERSSECSCCCSAGGTAKSPRLHESWTCQRTVEPTACYWSPQLAAPAHQLALDVRAPTAQRTSSCTAWLCTASVPASQRGVRRAPHAAGEYMYSRRVTVNHSNGLNPCLSFWRAVRGLARRRRRARAPLHCAHHAAPSRLAGHLRRGLYI